MMTPFKSSLGLALLAAGADRSPRPPVTATRSRSRRRFLGGRHQRYGQPAGDGRTLQSTNMKGWFEFQVRIPAAGGESVGVRTADGDGATVWIEDYVGNKDGRTYITSPIALRPSPRAAETSRIGSPLNAGEHRMRVHHAGDKVELSGSVSN